MAEATHSTRFNQGPILAEMRARKARFESFSPQEIEEIKKRNSDLAMQSLRQAGVMSVEGAAARQLVEEDEKKTEERRRRLFFAGSVLAAGLLGFALGRMSVNPEIVAPPQPTPEPTATSVPTLEPTNTPLPSPTATPLLLTPTPTYTPEPPSLWTGKNMEKNHFRWGDIADYLRKNHSELEEIPNQHDNFDRTANALSVLSLLAEEPEKTPDDARHDQPDKPYQFPSEEVAGPVIGCIQNNEQLDPQVDCDEVNYIADHPSLGKGSDWDDPQWQVTYEHAKRVEEGLETK